MCDNIKIVIGSWGSYNECNERALGSKWLDLSDYSDWDEIVEELKKEGFELDGIDEELFIQDVEGIEDGSISWDYVNLETLFNTLKESGVLDDDYKYKVFCAFLEVRCYDDFEEKVNTHGDRWDDCINLWSGYYLLKADVLDYERLEMLVKRHSLNQEVGTVLKQVGEIFADYEITDYAKKFESIEPIVIDYENKKGYKRRGTIIQRLCSLDSEKYLIEVGKDDH